jgi:hypothetical protein
MILLFLLFVAFFLKPTKQKPVIIQKKKRKKGRNFLFDSSISISPFFKKKYDVLNKYPNRKIENKQQKAFDEDFNFFKKTLNYGPLTRRMIQFVKIQGIHKTFWAFWRSKNK